MDITDIDGVGESLAEAMREHGLGTLRIVARATVEELAAVPGIGPVSGKRIRKAAKKLITPQVSIGRAGPAPEPPAEEPEEPWKVQAVAVRSNPKPTDSKKARRKAKRADRQSRKALAKAAKHEKKAASLKARMERQLKKAAKARDSA
jgi:hypothetical protein